ncbi:MAG: outer membrane protein assembly factor BamA [Candidatus Puniceispirillales bacterium WSBS_2018_MAG_OTU23]
MTNWFFYLDAPAKALSRLCMSFGVLLLLLLPQHVAAQANETLVNSIDVIGAERIDPETVLAYSPVSVGDSVTDGDLNGILTSLFKTDLFNDVGIELDGNRLIITVDENPIINRISIEGNDVLNDEQLLAFLGIKPRRVFTDKLALEAKATLIEVYRQSGRYAATIEPKIIELPDKRVDLVFEVNEGPLVKISKIKFIGNEEFSDRALKNIIESRESKWYVFFTADDKYDSGRLKLDIQQLRQFYLQNGYADIEISRASGELLSDRSGFVITFILEEGGQYNVSNVSIESQIEGVDIAALEAVSQVEIGTNYDVRVLEESLFLITNKLGEFGFAFVDVLPNITLNKKDLTLDINISIGSAERNYVEAINIKGNDRTLDKVIRREFALVEGDSFNRLRLTRSERNIRNLGYFSDVSVRVLPGSSAEQSVIDVDVDETTTGNFQVGFGYSTFDDGSLTFGINENNFLGTGRGARASLSLSGKSTNFRAGFTEPYLFDRNLLGSADVFRTESKYSNVTLKQEGFDFGVGFSARGDFRHRLGYIIAKTATNTKSNKSTSISGDEGSLLLSEISYSLTKDVRDSRVDPSEGYMWRVTESFAGIGGDVQFLKSQIRGQYLYPLLFKRVILGVDGAFGVVAGLGEKVTRSSRFTLGGNRVRGFDQSGIGPRDRGDRTGVGGNKYYTTSANITSDLGIDRDLGVRWTVFADAGSLWDTDFPTGVEGADESAVRTSFGYGILWDTALGPMSFSWAHPIKSQPYDKTRRFQFKFGGRF